MRAARSSIVNTCGLMSNNLGLEIVDSSTNGFSSIIVSIILLCNYLDPF